jgi:hypothetical protein
MDSEVKNIPDDYSNHPLVQNATDVHYNEMSKVEKICAWVCDEIGSPFALFAIIVIQVLWVVLGQTSNLDPYPYVFLLTISNVIQLILIFILAVGQRQSVQRSEIRSQTDHDSISRIMHHQDLQEKILLQILQHHDINSDEVKNVLAALNISSD